MKKLQWKLQEVEGFDKPKIVLEQYATSAELATQMLSYIHSEYDDIESKAVADFGCGTGMLSIAAALLGAGSVVGFDIDSDALEIAQRNCEEQEITIDFIQTDLETLTPPEGRQLFDVIITNPPFGTKKNAGIDVRFVQTALKFAPVVYSLHKTTTRKYFVTNSASWGAKLEVLAEMKFDLPKTYQFHKQKNVDIKVDLYRFTKF